MLKKFNGPNFKGIFVNGKLDGKVLQMMQDGSIESSSYMNGKLSKKLTFFDTKSQRITFG